MSKFKQKDFRVSVDLLEACQRELYFLYLVDSHPCLYQKGVVRRAIWRYEKFWMPLAANYTGKDEIVPPLDVHWVWHTHMLAPQYYRRDCMNMVGKIVPHKLLSSKEYSVAKSGTEKIWNQQCYEQYHVDIDNPINEGDAGAMGRTVISYDIVDAVSRQKEFNYQVSLPHFRDKKFIENGILRYKMLLFLKKLYPEEFVVPCYDSDLAWHSHQVHPEQYYQDTTRILGKMFNHDDNVTDRSPGSKLATADESTRQLWRRHFGDNYSCTGAMYRGERYFGLLLVVPKDLIKLICSKTFSISIYQVKLNYNGDFDAKSKIKFYLKNPQKTIVRFKGPLNTWGDGTCKKPLVTFKYDTGYNGFFVEVLQKKGFWSHKSLCGRKIMLAPFSLEQEVRKTIDLHLRKSATVSTETVS